MNQRKLIEFNARSFIFATMNESKQKHEPAISSCFLKGDRMVTPPKITKIKNTIAIMLSIRCKFTVRFSCCEIDFPLP